MLRARENHGLHLVLCLETVCAAAIVPAAFQRQGIEHTANLAIVHHPVPDAVDKELLGEIDIRSPVYGSNVVLHVRQHFGVARREESAPLVPEALETREVGSTRKFAEVAK